MSLTHDYRYDLTLKNASENDIENFSESLNRKRLGNYLGQDPESPYSFSSEFITGAGGLFESSVEEELHELAQEFPEVHFSFIAEDLDNSAHSFQLELQGDLYKRKDLIPAWETTCPFVPFNSRHDRMKIEMARSIDIYKMINRLCEDTDFDLLQAQKECLVKSQLTGSLIPPEAIDGIINFLDFVTDLGETIGLFQYDGIEPEYPLRDEYIKKSVSIPPTDNKPIYLLCEEYEDSDAIRSFTVHNVSYDKKALEANLSKMVNEDVYGMIKANGIADHDADHFSTNFKNGFVEYYILKQPVLDINLEEKIKTTTQSLDSLLKNIQTTGQSKDIKYPSRKDEYEK